MSTRRRSSRRAAQRPPTFLITSLGCPKNTVDAYGMATLLQRAGLQAKDDPARADVIIVNTCGFIAPAREESLETLTELAAALRPEQRLVAAGCWAQREPEQLVQLLPRLDAIIGTRDWPAIVALVQQLREREAGAALQYLQNRAMPLPETFGAPGYAVFGASAFLKIADGCSRRCAFCAIPLIKGDNVSRPIAAILDDARALRDQGVLEVNLISQDTTFYGHDLGMQDGLAELLEALVTAVPEIPWLRVLYAYPGYITPRLIEVLARHAQLLPYIDIPLQHAHPDILRRMRRPADVDWVREAVAQLRAAMPDVVIRTTFIVGFPGETHAEFQALREFIEELRFERVGAFTYSHEVNTPAGALPDNVPAEVKAARLEELMLAQQTISLEANRAWVGRTLPVLLEGAGDGLTVGRSYRDAPEIDGLVLLSADLDYPQLMDVTITDATVYDLIGVPVNNQRRVRHSSQ